MATALEMEPLTNPLLRLLLSWTLGDEAGTRSLSPLLSSLGLGTEAGA